jgi:hypothetical protein
VVPVWVVVLIALIGVPVAGLGVVFLALSSMRVDPVAAAWAMTNSPDAMTAQRLLDDYEANAVEADRRYQGRRFIVTGAVQKVDSALFGGLVVYLEGTLTRDVVCFFSGAHRDRIAALRPGQVVHVRGQCTGKTMMIVNFHDCEFVDGPPPGYDPGRQGG